MTSPVSEFDVRHHDLPAKLRSIVDAFADPFDPAIARLGIQATLVMSGSMWRRGSFQPFEPVVAHGVATAERLGDRDSLAALLTLQAGLREALGDWITTLSLARRARPLIRSPTVAVDLSVYAGAAAHNLGRYRQALDILADGAAAASDSAGRRRVLHKQHRTLAALGRRREALKLLEDVFSVPPEIEPWFHAEVMLDKAALLRRSNPSEALHLCEEAKSLSERSGFYRGVAYAELEYGRVQVVQGRHSLAAVAFSNARRAFDETRYSPGRSHVRFEQGRQELTAYRFDIAADLFSEAAEIAQYNNYRSALLRARSYECWASLRSGRAFQTTSAAWQTATVLAHTLVQRSAAWLSLLCSSRA